VCAGGRDDYYPKARSTGGMTGRLRARLSGKILIMKLRLWWPTRQGACCSDFPVAGEAHPGDFPGWRPGLSMAGSIGSNGDPKVAVLFWQVSGDAFSSGNTGQSDKAGGKQPGGGRNRHD